MKKFLFILNYYAPYISGVTECARLLCESFVNKGYNVEVLTSNHANLPSEEVINGVHVLRAPILCKISKGTISPAFITMAVKLSKQADIVNLHLPMLESGIIASLIDKRKLVVTYQCDINLPKTFINQFIVAAMDFSHDICLKKSKSILVTSVDYAMHSRIAYRYKDKLVEAPTPIKNLIPSQCKAKYTMQTIGFCGRIVEEKGIDLLLKSFQNICRKRSNLQLLIGGDYENIAGGSVYPLLKNYIEENHVENVMFLGKIPEEKMAEFYSSLDVFVLPSLNSLEAFGMVQIEAMRCGTPVVASDLYGVRTIIQNTGMGLVFKQKDEQDLERCILEVLDHKENYVKPLKYIESFYSTKKSTQDYENCFLKIINQKINAKK